jgi:acetyltransferase
MHRAEVQKLLVHTCARQRGLGRRLMAAIEEEARCSGRSLLYLDTEPGKPAEALYRKLGWTYTGEIPDYFYTTDGQLKATAFFFKRLGG